MKSSLTFLAILLLTMPFVASPSRADLGLTKIGDSEVDAHALTIQGGFGQVEGWIRIGDVDTVPTGFSAQVTKGQIDLCGRSRDGGIFLM